MTSNKSEKEINKLIDIIFSGMLRNSEKKYSYFNKQTQIVFAEISGYLSNMISENQTLENRLLSEKIQSSAPFDKIDSNVLVQIPSLSKTVLFENINAHFEQYFMFNEYAISVENAILMQSIDIDSYNKVLGYLYKWQEQVGSNFITKAEFESKIQLIQREIAKEWLNTID